MMAMLRVRNRFGGSFRSKPPSSMMESVVWLSFELAGAEYSRRIEYLAGFLLDLGPSVVSFPP
jgi:hypothetical protein